MIHFPNSFACHLFTSHFPLILFSCLLFSDAIFPDNFSCKNQVTYVSRSETPQSIYGHAPEYSSGGMTVSVRLLTTVADRSCMQAISVSEADPSSDYMCNYSHGKYDEVESFRLTTGHESFTRHCENWSVDANHHCV